MDVLRARVSIVPPARQQRRGTLYIAGSLTPYDVELIVDDAVDAARLELVLSSEVVAAQAARLVARIVRRLPRTEVAVRCGEGGEDPSSVDLPGRTADHIAEEGGAASPRPPSSAGGTRGR